MAKKITALSLSSKGIKYKLRIAFYLMSVLPLLVCGSLVSNYILPRMGFKLDVTVGAFVTISIVVAVAGYFVIKEVVDRILSVSNEAKLIAAGDISRSVDVRHEDEVGDLGKSLNELTQRIRSNMDELKNYSERTTEINLEIQKRVLVLSSLLQISALISQSAKLEDILKVTVEKSRLLASSEVAYLLYREEGQEAFEIKMSDGINSSYLLGVRLEPQDSLFHKIAETSRVFTVDEKNMLPEKMQDLFYEKFRLKNSLAIPVYLRGRVLGILGIGNSQDKFSYRKDDVELLDIFAKQIAIGIENDILMHRVEKLEVKDALTGLYNEAFVRSRLQEEIKRAIMYRRPCAFALLNIDNFKDFHNKYGLLQAEGVLKKMASLVSGSVTEIDRVGRFSDNEFAVVLPEKNKRQAQEIAEGIRQKIEAAFSQEQEAERKLTVSGGVSENPLDGVEAAELVAKAKDSLNMAKRQGKNRIIC